MNAFEVEILIKIGVGEEEITFFALSYSSFNSINLSLSPVSLLSGWYVLLSNLYIFSN